MKSIRSILFILLTLGITQVAFEASAEECSPVGQPVDSAQNCCPAPFNAYTVVALDGVCRQQPPLCIAKNEALHDGLGCCAGLNLVNGTCKDPSPVDPTIVSCETNPSICTGGMGCFPQRSDDLFSTPPETDTELNSQSVLTSEIENTEESARPDGQYCIKNTQCKSYSCQNMLCALTKICRKADDGETAGTALCEDGLIIDPVTGKCKTDPASTVQGTAIGPTDPTRDPTNMCRFNFPEGMKERAEYAIRQTRAMEWFLNSISNQDCFRVHNYLIGIGQKLVTQRREILRTFNIGMSKIDGDMKILLASKEPGADPNKVVTINGQTMTNKELAGRLTSGVDMVQAMIQRNIVFKVYESEMNKLTNITSQRIKALSDLYENQTSGWGDHQSRNWVVPRENSVSADGMTANITLQYYHGNDQLTCRGGGFLGLARRRVYKRWHHAHLFRSIVFNNENIQQELAQIIYPDKVVRVGIDTVAAQTALKSAMNLPNGRYLYGLDEVNGLRDFPAVRNSVKAFVAALKSDATLSGFNHEPELLPLQAKDCTDTSVNPDCAKFRDFIDSVAKSSYAQIYAFKTHTRSNYKFYFNGNSTMRKRLIKGWWKQLDALTDYYKSMATYREQQNECLAKLDVNANLLLDNSISGINEGAQNYYVGSDYVGAPSGQLNNTPGSGPIFASQNAFEFESNLLKSLSWNNNNSNPASTTTSGAGSGSGLLAVNTASLASRVRSAKDVLGSGTSGKEGSSKTESSGSAVAASKGGAGSGSGSSSSDSSSDSSLSTAKGGKASLMDDMMNKANAKSGSDADATKGLVKGSGSGADGLGAAGYAAGAGSGFGSGSGTDANANAGKDPTGMSDEEKDIMMANFERTKSRYNTKEDDSLFTIINKTYVRNLDKILKKKPSSAPE